MSLKKTFFLTLLFSIAVQFYGQEIPFKNYTVKGGYNLPSNEFYDIVQDKQGFIWLGTIAGLVKFDGYNFITYTTRDGLADNSISALLVDKEGKLWVGTENGGISVFSKEHFKNITTANGLVSNNIGKLFADKSNNIWAVGYNGGISIISKLAVRSFNEQNSVLKSEIKCYLVDSKGKVFLGNADGLYSFDTSFKSVDNSQLSGSVVWDIAEDRTGNFWVATQRKGVFCINRDTVINYSTENGLSSNTALSILSASDGKIYIGTYDGGLNVIENFKIKKSVRSTDATIGIWDLYEDKKGRVWGNAIGNGLILISNSLEKHLTKSNLLVDNTVTKIFEDDNTNLWFTTQNGISMLGKTNFENFSSGFPGNDKKVLSIYAARNGRVYAGTYLGLNVLVEGDTIINQIYSGKLPADPSVYSIAGGSKNELWMGTNGGLSHLGNELTYIPINISSVAIDPEYITYSIATTKDNVYLATNYGLLIYSNKNYRLLTTANGLSDNMVLSVAVDKNNQVWCGTANGLSIFSNNTFRNFTNVNGISNNICNDIAFDSTGVAWIATEYGITSAVLDKGNSLSTRNYSTADGLGSNTALSVLVDNHQQIWIGHNRGVDCLNPRTKVIRNYTNLEGFLPVENALGAISIDNFNDIWFGTVDGLVKYMPENDIVNRLPPKIYITKVELYNDTSSLKNYYSGIDSITLLPKDLKLNWRKRNLVFQYVGLHYTVVEKNKYKYRLLGYDNEWSQPINSIVSIPFQRIPPGTYTFQVMAANCDGVWNEQPAGFSFQIMPPFWQTWWARILELIIALSLFGLIIYLRERKLVNDKKVLTQKVKERTLEIEKQKDQIEDQRDEITRQKQDITDSIEYAKHIQSAILPKHDTIAPLLKDYFILYKPRDIVSGDFYWVNAYGNKVLAIAADCTGHGVPGAFMSMLGVSTLNEITANNSSLRAGEILNMLREHIIATLSHTKGSDEARDGMDIALCIFDFKFQKAEFSGAFNPLVLIRNKEEIVYKADKMPVGLHSGEQQSFTTTEIEIQKGDCLYMFSDGYADQFGGPDGKKFKSANFRSVLCEISNLPMEDQKEYLNSTIENWMLNQEQIDDIMVMGIRI